MDRPRRRMHFSTAFSTTRPDLSGPRADPSGGRSGGGPTKDMATLLASCRNLINDIWAKHGNPNAQRADEIIHRCDYMPHDFYRALC